MRISCPQCSSQYNVDEKRIPPQGVQIKCPKCLHAFVVAQPAEDSTHIGAVPLPGGGGAVPLPGGGGGSGAVPLPGGGGGGAVALPGAGGRGAVPLPGGGGAVPLPGGGGAVPLPGGGGGGAIPLPGGGGGLGGSRNAAVALPGMGRPAAAPQEDDPFGGPPPSNPFAAAGSQEDDPFASPPSSGAPEDDPFAAPPPQAGFAPSRGFSSDAALGGSSGGSGMSENSVVSHPFHGQTQARAPQQPAGQSMPLDGGVLDFIDRAASDSGPARNKSMFRIRKRSGKVVGPFDEATVLKMLRSQELNGSEEASEDGVVWKPLSTVAAFATEIQSLMASALGALGDLPAPVSGGGHGGGFGGSSFGNVSGGGGASGGMSSSHIPSMESLSQDEEPVAKPAGKKKGGAAAGGKDGARFPVKLVAGAGGAVAFVALGLVTAFGFPEQGLFFHKSIARLFSGSSKTGPEIAAPVAPPTPVFHKDATTASLLAEDNFQSYVEAQKQLAAVEGTGAQMELAKAFALPAYLDKHPELAAKASEALAKAAGADARLVATVELFVALAGGAFDTQLAGALAVAGPVDGDLKETEEVARNAESWVQTAAGYAMLEKGNKPEDAMARFDRALMAWPDNLLATVGQTRALLLAKDPDSALGYAERAVALQKENLRARIILGQLLLRAGRYNTSKEHLQFAVGVSGAKGTPQQRSEARVLLSEVAVRDKDFKEAAEQLRQASAELPEDLDLKARSGDLLLRLREWPQARQAFDDILAIKADYEPAIIGSARAKMGATDALGAFKQLQEATTKAPQSAVLKYWFGQANEALGKIPEAVKQYKSAETLDPRRALPVVAQANLLLKERKYADTLSAVTAARGRVAPEEDPLLRAVLARTYVKQRQYALAFKEFEAAIAASPTNSDTRALYGAALRDAGRFEEARKNLAQALDEDPKNAMILAEMGSYYVSQGQYERAIDLFQTAITVAPKEPDYYIRLGAATYSKGDSSGAIEFLKTAQTYAPTNPDVFYWMALATRKTDPERAKSLLKQGLELAPEDGRFDHELGRSLFAEGAMVEAADYLRAAIRKDANNGDAYYELGKCYAEQARYAEARDQFQRAVQLMPGKAFIRLQIAESYAHAGQYVEAAREYQKAISQDSSLSEAYCKLGDMYRNDGKNKPANDMYHKCTELVPKHKEAWKWMGHTYEGMGGKPNMKKAADAWRKHFEVNPDDPDNDELKERISDSGR